MLDGVATVYGRIGGAEAVTLLLDNPVFFYWKPTVFYWALAVACIASHFIGEAFCQRRVEHAGKAIFRIDRRTMY